MEQGAKTAEQSSMARWGAGKLGCALSAFSHFQILHVTDARGHMEEHRKTINDSMVHAKRLSTNKHVGRMLD